MDRIDATSQRDAVSYARMQGRRYMSRCENVISVVIAFLFCVAVTLLVSFVVDVMCVYLLPVRYTGMFFDLGLVLLFFVYSMADAVLVRFGIRAGRDDADLSCFFGRRGGSGFVAALAMGLGALAKVAAAMMLYAYINVFGPHVSNVIGRGAHVLCTVLVVFVVTVVMIYISTGFFFLPAVGEREKRNLFGLIRASFRAARGNRKKIVKFFLSFSGLTVLSLLSLGILFFVYVVPFYILSYGAFATEILDYKEI